MRTQRILALAGAAAVAATAFPAAAGATWSGKPGRIAYYALSDGPNAIYSIRPDGTRNRRLVRADGGVAWSRDGKRIAFFRGGVNDEIWQARADGSHARRVLNIPNARVTRGRYGSDLAWSPNGRRLVFAATLEEQTGEEEIRETSTVYTVRRNGRGVRRIRNGHDPTWSSTGLIAFAKENGDIATIRPDGRGARRVWRPKGTPYVSGLDFSPNGRRLVFQQGASIRTLDLSNGRRTRIRDRTKRINAIDVVWTPGGGRLAYLHWTNVADGPAPPHEVRTMRPTGKRRKTVLKLPGRVTAFELAWQAR